jgi:DNA-binding CsgD family transcriptional regulator
MGELDQILGTIEKIHAAGLDRGLWPAALTALSETFGAVGCVLELVERESRNHLIFESHGLPTATELAYLDQYVAINPRMRMATLHSPGDLLWDYQFLAEAEIDRSAFYAEFLRAQDMRYFLAGVLDTEPRLLGAVTLQFSPGQGHADTARIALMGRLAPHVSLALDARRRLTGAVGAGAFREALDQLSDGAALLAADGRVLWVNAAMAAIAAAGDGLRISRGRVAFRLPVAERAFLRALAAVRRLRDGEPRDPARDFDGPRATGAAPYRVSVRPIPGGFEDAEGAAFLLLARDPVGSATHGEEVMRRTFDLTPAEAHLAMDLCRGVSPGAYAGRRGVSANTVYTHMRRLKDKCGAARTVELIATLNAARGAPPPGAE